MGKTKNSFGWILVTLVIWGISRFIPAFVNAVYPSSVIPKAIALIATLPIGWIVGEAISKGRYLRCIRVNLYLFAAIEGLGVLEVFTYLLQNLAFYTGQYQYDVNGVAYSDYFFIFGGVILYEAVYITLCFYFAKNTTAVSREIFAPQKKAEDGIDGEKQRFENENTRADPKENVISKTNMRDDSTSLKRSATSKQRYCKYCGGAVDGETRKCTKCGKQYVRTGRIIKMLSMILAVIAILGLAALSVYQSTQITDLEATVQQQQTEIEQKQTEIEQKQATIKSRNETIEELTQESIDIKKNLRALLEEVEFYDAYVVFVNNDGTNLYHNYNCSDFDTSYFWAYNTEAAEGKGFNPCPKCCE